LDRNHAAVEEELVSWYFLMAKVAVLQEGRGKVAYY